MFVECLCPCSSVWPLRIYSLDVDGKREQVTFSFASIITVAIFIAGVTATALQITVALTPSKIDSETNFFWLTSLNLSAHSVLVSLIAGSWQSKERHGPGKVQPPALIRFWLTNASYFLLVLASVAFLAGVNLLPYSYGAVRIPLYTECRN